MTRAGEKLYGDWQRAIDADRRRRPARWMLRGGFSVLLLLTVASAALFGFGR